MPVWFGITVFPFESTKGGSPNKVHVKCIASAGVVIERRRQLKIHVLVPVVTRAHLPAQQKRVYSRHSDWRRADRVFRVSVVVDKLPEVGEEIERWAGNRFGCLGNDRLAILVRRRL